MIRKTAIAFGLVLSLVIAVVSLDVSASASRHHHPPPTTTTTSTSTTIPPTTTTTTQPGTSQPGLLPGETTWSSGAPSFDFGTNDTINYGTPNVDTLSSVQADLKGGGLTILRVWAYGSDSDATILQKVAAATGSGEVCMFMLGQTNDLTWLEHVVTETEANCPYYEFGNEPDNGGSPANGSIATYTSQWIADIPQLRAIDPKAQFGGPVIMWSGSCCQFSGTTYPDDMAYFLGVTAQAGVRADFIDYHDYPCTAGKQDTEAACLAATPGDFAWNWNNVIPYEQQYYGKVIPTGVSEYNFDPGDQHLYDWCNDSTFMTQWTTAALDEIVKLRMSFANQFDSLNWGGYGCYDMFSDAAPYAAKPQFDAITSEIQKYGGP